MPTVTEQKDIKQASNYATLKVVNGDLSFNVGGKVECVTHLDKLSQTIQMELSLVYMSDSDRGNRTFTTIENAPSERTYALNLIRNDFLDALLRIQQRQGAKTPPAEVLSKILSVDAAYDSKDPTTVNVNVSVENALKQSLTLGYQVNPDILSIKLVL